MGRYEHGRVLAANETKLGSQLVADHAAAVTSLTVEDPVDFDEDGGSLIINAQVIAYSTFDDDTGVITLSGTLTAAAAEGDRVNVYDALYQTVSTEKIAQVELGGDDDNTDPIEATIAHHLVDQLEEGIRGTTGESVLLELDGDEWRIVDILGLSTAAGTKFEADDVYVITAGNITAGTATQPLTHRPIDESVVGFWGTTPQEPTEYTIDYDAQTVTWPLAGFEKAGDRLWVHYAYLSGRLPPGVPFASSGWSYLQVAAADVTDRSAVAFDDSAWAVAAAPFSNDLSYTAVVGWPAPVTIWDAQTAIWMRRTIQAAGVVTLQMRVDNWCDVYWNGTKIRTDARGGGIVSDVELVVPANLVQATNVLAVHAVDDQLVGADDTYADIQVTMS